MILSNGSQLDQSRIEIWWAALGAGLVVIACVVILLTLMSAFVRDIEARLQVAVTETHVAAAQVAASDLVGEAAVLIHDLAGELERHVTVVSAASSEAS